LGPAEFRLSQRRFDRQHAAGYADGMTPLTYARLFTIALALIWVAQVAPPWASAALAQEEAPKADKRAAPASGLPHTPAERDTVLSELYERLATSEDEKAAKSAAESIERVWIHSGSPTVDLLFGRAMQAIGEKNYDRALRFLDHVVEQAPDFTEGWSRRAFVHFQLGNVRPAVGDLRRAIALDPHHFKALDGLAQVLRDIGEKRAALQVLRRLAEVHPYWEGAEQAIEELAREVEGQGI
jgi:tetratricopeptide (TPR) repeat protein